MQSHTLRAERDLVSHLGSPFHFIDKENHVQKREVNAQDHTTGKKPGYVLYRLNKVKIMATKFG